MIIGPNGPFVTMDHKLCIVCGNRYNSGDILLSSLSPVVTPTGWGLCDEDEQLRKDGFLALVEAKNIPTNGDVMKPEDADRTGRVAHIKREVLTRVFNCPIPDGAPVAFVEVGVIDKLLRMRQES
jgi:hypothetical protein